MKCCLQLLHLVYNLELNNNALHLSNSCVENNDVVKSWRVHYMYCKDMYFLYLFIYLSEFCSILRDQLYCILKDLRLSKAVVKPYALM